MVYPNPVSEVFTVSADISLKGYELRLLDILGREQEVEIISENEYQIQLKRTPSLLSGIYLLWLKMGDKQFIQKVIIKE